MIATNAVSRNFIASPLATARAVIYRSAKKELVKVRTMNLGVAHRAGLVLCILRMKARHLWHVPGDCGRMALQAQNIDLAYPQQTRVCRAMWRVTTGAALLLHGNVLEDEGPHSFRVAIRADGELAGSSAQLTTDKTPMRVMTVAALDQTYVDAMAVRAVELRFLRGMAAVAEKSLLCF